MENIHEPQGKVKSPTPLAASMLYLVVLTLMILSSFLLGGRDIQGINYYILMFLIEFVTIFLPPLIYMLYQKIDIKKATRLNKISVPEILLSIGMSVFGYGVIIAVNLVWVWLLSKFGTPQAATLPPIETGQQFIMAIVVIAVVPALFEEFLFRGVIQRGYEKIGRNVSIIFTGLLFAFLHLSIVSLPSIILMGMLLCYVNYRSNSLWSGAIYHFVNNSVAVTLTFIAGFITKLFPMEGAAQSLADLPPETLLAGMLAWGFIGTFALVLFAACFAGFHIITRGKQEVMIKKTNQVTTKRGLELLPAILAMVVVVILLVMEVIQMVNPVI